MKYGHLELFELEGENPHEVVTVTAAEFMIHEIEKDDLVAQHELFRIIFAGVKENLENEAFDPWRFFVHHQNAKVSQLATNLLSDKHNESNIWKRGGGFTESEEDILELLVPKVINEYKWRKIRQMLTGIEKEIDKASAENDFDRVIDEQSKYLNLKRVEKELAEKLGNRTII